MLDNTFLQRQLDLLKSKKQDKNIHWQDIANFRSSEIGSNESKDLLRQGSRLLFEYLENGWDLYPTSKLNSLDIIDIQKERYKVQTEKLEYNKWLREDARDEMILESILSAINKLEPLPVPD